LSDSGNPTFALYGNTIDKMDWFEDPSDDTFEITNEFEIAGPEFEMATASDIMSMYLAAAYPGMKVVGVDLTATSETVTKAPNEIDHQTTKGYAFGEVTWDMTTMRDDQEASGEELYDMPYSSGQFYGVTTTQCALNLFDKSAIRSDSLDMTLSAMKLYNYTVAAGNNSEDALDFVSAAAGKNMEFLEPFKVILPDSFMKRSMLSGGKATYKTHFPKIAHRAINVHLEQYTAEKIAPNAAVDFGRLTTITRAYAANQLFFDPSIAQIARKKPLTMRIGIINRAYAVIKRPDYILPMEKAIEPVTRKMVFASETEVTELLLQKAPDLTKFLSDVGQGLDAEGLIYNTWLTRMKNLITAKIKISSTRDVEIELDDVLLPQAPMSTQEAAIKAGIEATKGTIHNFVKDQVVMDAKNNPKIKSALFQAKENRKRWVHKPSYTQGSEETRLAFNRIFSTEFWLSVSLRAVSVLREENVARVRLMRYMRSFFEASIDEITNIPGHDKNKDKIAKRVEELLAACSWMNDVPPDPVIEYHKATRRTITQPGVAVKSLIKKIASAWSKRYTASSEALKTMGVEYDLMIKYQGIARAMDLATYEGLIDLDNSCSILDDKNWLVVMFGNWARKRKFDFELTTALLDELGNTRQLAMYLDSEFDPITSFCDVESFVADRLRMVALDVISFSTGVLQENDVNILTPDDVDCSRFEILLRENEMRIEEKKKEEELVPDQFDALDDMFDDLMGDLGTYENDPAEAARISWGPALSDVMEFMGLNDEVEFFSVTNVKRNKDSWSLSELLEFDKWTKVNRASATEDEGGVADALV